MRDTQIFSGVLDGVCPVILIIAIAASVRTDPDLADATYIEALTIEIVEKIIARERPDALLPTVGGQTALNLGVALAEQGILAAHGVQLIGASLNAMKVAEDRLLFKEAMIRAGLSVPRSGLAATCLLYTSDAADERSSVDLGGRRIIKKKKKTKHTVRRVEVDHKE